MSSQEKGVWAAIIAIAAIICVILYAVLIRIELNRRRERDAGGVQHVRTVDEPLLEEVGGFQQQAGDIPVPATATGAKHTNTNVFDIVSETDPGFASDTEGDHLSDKGL
jgi:hypothetical protein